MVDARYEDRPFQPDSTRPREVIAEALARYDGADAIRPEHWWRADRVERALRKQGLLADGRKVRARRCAEEQRNGHGSG